MTRKPVLIGAAVVCAAAGAAGVVWQARAETTHPARARAAMQMQVLADAVARNPAAAASLAGPDVVRVARSSDQGTVGTLAVRVDGACIGFDVFLPNSWLLTGDAAGVRVGRVDERPDADCHGGGSGPSGSDSSD